MNSRRRRLAALLLAILAIGAAVVGLTMNVAPGCRGVPRRVRGSRQRCARRTGNDDDRAPDNGNMVFRGSTSG